MIEGHVKLWAGRVENLIPNLRLVIPDDRNVDDYANADRSKTVEFEG